MTDRELMQQALEALEKMKSHSYLRLDYAEEAINALSDRLAQPEQGHTGFMDSKINPIQRPWVGLTDEELEAMAEKFVTNCYFDTLKYARAIEGKLKEKNNG